MKKLVVLFAMLTIVSVASYGCDVCGCSLGGGYYGILPQFNKNFLGIRWSQAKFYAHMNHDSEYLGSEHSNDTYSKLELWGRYYVSKRFQMFAFIPYAFNTMNGTEQKLSVNGLGDITIMGNYLLLNTGEKKGAVFKHTLMAGGGVKVPTGKYNLEDNGTIVNRNFQLGTGSVDFVVSGVYTLRYGKTGLNTEGGYKMNTRNSHDYRFGNQFHVSSQLFYWQNIGAIRLLPNAGLYYEKAAKHKDGEIIQNNTGGSALLATAGLETYIKRVGIGFSYQHPLAQQYNSDDIADIKSKDRITLSLSFSF